MNNNKLPIRFGLTDIPINSVLKVAFSNTISFEIKLEIEKRCQISKISKGNYWYWFFFL